MSLSDVVFNITGEWQQRAISEYKQYSRFASALPYARQRAKVQAGYAANETNKIISKNIG